MKIKFIGSLLFVMSFSLQAQTVHTFQVWTDYTHWNNLSGNWTFFNDAGLRASELQSNGYWRLHVRPSVEYKRQILHVFRAGVGLFYQDNIGSIKTFELRPWQGYKLNWPNFKRFRVYNYVRLEERMTTDLGSEGVAFTLKLRYKVGTRIPIGDRSIRVGTYYIPISIELFGDLAIFNQQVLSDRNRYEIGIGQRVREDLRVQILYTYQGIRNNRNDGNIQSDHIVRISVIQNFNLE